ncbi:MAG: DUF3244 domain-containing protein [Parabacteroides sp.]|nr:DUF3244 domain-containing protein [Parabacteroides sp.]
MLKRILFLVILMTSLNCYAEDVQKIILFGWDLESDKFSLEICEENDCLQLTFSQEQVCLDLQIFDDEGNCVYKEYLDSSHSTEYIIPIDNLQDGSYRLLLENETGEQAEGLFEKK